MDLKSKMPKRKYTKKAASSSVEGTIQMPNDLEMIEESSNFALLNSDKPKPKRKSNKKEPQNEDVSLEIHSDHSEKVNNASGLAQKELIMSKISEKENQTISKTVKRNAPEHDENLIKLTQSAVLPVEDSVVSKIDVKTKRQRTENDLKAFERKTTANNANKVTSNLT